MEMINSTAIPFYANAGMLETYGSPYGMTPPPYIMDGPFSMASGRRNECKAKGYKGKALRDCVERLRSEDAKKTKAQRKADARARKSKYGAHSKPKSQRRASIKRFSSDSWRKAAKVMPFFVLARNSFIVLVRGNVFALASKMASINARAAKGDITAKKAQSELNERWKNFGGDVNHLEAAVSDGAKRKPIAGKIPQPQSKSGFSSFVDPGTASIIGSAATVLAAVLPVLAKGREPAEISDDSLDDINDLALEGIDESDGLSEADKSMMEDVIESSGSDDNGATSGNGLIWLAIGVGVLAVALAVIYKKK